MKWVLLLDRTPKGKEVFQYPSKEKMFEAVSQVVDLAGQTGHVVTFGDGYDYYEDPVEGELVVRMGHKANPHCGNSHWGFTYLLPKCGGGTWPDFDLWWRRNKRKKNKVTID